MASTILVLAKDTSALEFCNAERHGEASPGAQQNLRNIVRVGRQIRKCEATVCICFLNRRIASIESSGNEADVAKFFRRTAIGIHYADIDFSTGKRERLFEAVGLFVMSG